MRSSHLFYQESGRFNIGKNTIAYFLCAALAIVAGYFYAILIGFIPVIYFNVLITFGFGIGISFVCLFINKLSHNRSRKSRLGLVVFFGVLANYSQFTAFVMRLYMRDELDLSSFFSGLGWIFNPEAFLEQISYINEVGAWKIIGITFNGIQLSLIWLMEMFIIIAIPVGVVYKKKEAPYSEINQKWYGKYVLFDDFEAISAVSLLLKDLERNPLEALQGLGMGGGYRKSKVYLYYMKEEEKQYLTVANHLIDPGSNKSKSDIMINNFKINKNVANAILEQFETKRERIEVF